MNNSRNSSLNRSSEGRLPAGKLPARIMAIDLDDTLLREDLTISPYTVQTLQKATAAGIYVTLCSGRTDNAILPFVRQGHPKMDPFVRAGKEEPQVLDFATQNLGRILHSVRLDSYHV